VRRELTGDEGANGEARCELHGLREREARERSERDVAAPLPEEGLLEVGVGRLEGVVVPVEASAALRGRDQQTEEHRAEQRLVLAGAGAGVRPREDRCGRLAAELLEGEARVVSSGQDRLVLLDERTDERLELVQRGPAPLDVLLEGERQLGSLLELASEQHERAEHEATEERIEVRGPHGHDSGVRERGGVSSAHG
jgi:hypothetical protein